MPDYLVEVYLSPSSAAGASVSREDVCRAAEELTQQGLDIQLTQLIVMPEDETCLYLFEAASEQAVLLAVSRAGLTCNRLTPALSTPTAGHRPAGHSKSTSAEEY